MKALVTRTLALIAIAGLWLIDVAPESALTPVFVGEAQAIIGRPLTPVSYAGVARRTTRRVVYADTVTTAAAASADSDSDDSDDSNTTTAAAPTVGPPPSGTVTTALPSGCLSTEVDGTQYFNCGGVYYKPTFQSGNVVYVVK